MTLNLFESNWWDSLKNNVLKSVNKLSFGQNNKKVGKFSFLYFLDLLFKSGKIPLGNSEKSVPFPIIDVLLMLKNRNVLFSSRRKYFK